MEQTVRNYLEQPNTYLDATGEAVTEASAVFTVVENMLSQVSSIWLHIMQELVKKGLNPVKVVAGFICPNSWRSRDRVKQEMLDLAATVCRLVSSLHTACIAAGICVFSGRLDCRLLRTHRAECMLF